MNILHVNDNDLPGRRFNGYDLQLMLNKKKEFSAKQVVVLKSSKNKNVLPLIKSKRGNFIREKCVEFEERISMQSVIYPFGEILRNSNVFKEADIVHYHLIFNHFMSLYSFRKLAQLKPTVWTLHDPWALTGHCVHPIDCKGWLTGCKECPYLDRYAPLKEDNASSIWNIKKDIYSDIDIDIVVASQWMYDMVKESPLTKHFKRVHLIPFGIDLDLFNRRENRDEIRKKLGIPKKNFVMMFRQDPLEWKGLKYIKLMLDKLNLRIPITLLTVGKIGYLESYKKKFTAIEYGWVNDENLMVDLYSAADLFLMPSIAESFGLMAVEAMACSLPVVVFNGTALPSVTFSPECGIVVNKSNNKKFVEIISRLASSTKESRIRGEKGRELAEKYYNIDKYNKEIINLYNGIIYKSHI